MNPTHTATAAELEEWFEEVLRFCEGTLLAASDTSEHRAIIAHLMLTRSAKELVHADLDREGSLYKPTCLVLATAARELGLALRRQNWKAALGNVFRLREQLEKMTSAPFRVDSSANLLKEVLDESLVNAGVTDRPTILVEENRRLALALAVNWAMRFLIAYALECTPTEKNPKAKDLAWLKKRLEAAS